MISIPKIVGTLSCSFLLCVGLSHTAQADDAASAQDKMKAEQSVTFPRLLHHDQRS